jgi:hypothetical protein
MPKYSAWYDNRDPENTRLMDAMSDLRRMCCTAEHTNPHTLRPGSFAAMAIMKISRDKHDFWEKMDIACPKLDGDNFLLPFEDLPRLEKPK